AARLLRRHPDQPQRRHRRRLRGVGPAGLLGAVPSGGRARPARRLGALRPLPGRGDAAMKAPIPPSLMIKTWSVPPGPSPPRPSSPTSHPPTRARRETTKARISFFLLFPTPSLPAGGREAGERGKGE